MSFCPFDPDELENAKYIFAKAFYSATKKQPFGVDPFAVALSVWSDENDTAKALWAIHAQKWHMSSDVQSIIDELKDEDKNEKIEHISTDEFKNELRLEIINEMRMIMKSPLYEAKDRIGAADRLSKLVALDEKPNNDGVTQNFIGIIPAPLAGLPSADFQTLALRQQNALQDKLIELAADDVRTIN